MVCPVCAIAVGAGVGILRRMGVDDVITGLWVGALIVALIAWTIDYLNRKNVHFLFRKILVIAIWYALILVPLYYLGFMGVGNAILGVDRLLLGTALGTGIFILAVVSDSHLRKINNSQIVIHYQKVLVPLAYLIISSVIMHLLLGVL